MITQHELSRLLNYDPLSGLFYWKNPTSNRVRVGQVAGTIRPDGYTQISLHGVLYLGHTLAWFYINGEWLLDIDHRDTIKSHNSEANLRRAGKSNNSFNVSKTIRNKSGYKGVSLCKQTGRWVAAICAYRKIKHLGRFATASEAGAVYAAAAQKLHGEFHRT